MTETIDRDVRLNPGQINYMQRLVNKRTSELGRKISEAEARRANGHTIQHGTLDAHYTELKELGRLRVVLDVAYRQIQRKIKASLEPMAEDEFNNVVEAVEAGRFP